jgi:hypothetical protein
MTISVGILYPTATSDMVAVALKEDEEEEDVVDEVRTPLATVLLGDDAAVAAKEMKAGDFFVKNDDDGVLAVTTTALRETRASVRRGVKRVNERVMIMALEEFSCALLPSCNECEV